MDDSRDWRLPLLFFTLLTVVVLSRLEATRDHVARAVAVLLPLVTVGRGVAPFRDAAGPMRAAAFVLALVVLGASEAAVSGALGVVHWSLSSMRIVTAILLGGAVVAVALEGLEARAGLRTRLAGWTGMAVALAVYLPGHYEPANAFATILVGFFVALFIGGGAGLLSGAALVSLLRRL